MRRKITDAQPAQVVQCADCSARYAAPSSLTLEEVGEQYTCDRCDGHVFLRLQSHLDSGAYKLLLTMAACALIGGLLDGGMGVLFGVLLGIALG